MRTPDAQVVAVQRRLLQSMPEFAELQRQTNIDPRILVELVRAFASAPTGPYIHVLGLHVRWRQDASLASGTYYTFTQWIAHHAPPPVPLDRDDI